MFFEINVVPQNPENVRPVLHHHYLEQFGAYVYIPILDILFLSNHNIHKSLWDLCFWASDTLIERF